MQSLCTSMKPFTQSNRTPGQRSAHLPPAALWRPWASHLAPVQPAWPAELQLLWLRGAAGACLPLLRTLQGQPDQQGSVPLGGTKCSTTGSALHNSHCLPELQTVGCLLSRPTHRGLVRCCSLAKSHALRIHAMCCAMLTTHATAISGQLCTSRMRPANKPGLPSLLCSLCYSI